MSIKQIEMLQSFYDQVSSLDQRTLVVFDVGDCLLMTRDKILRHRAKPVRERLQKELYHFLGHEGHTELWSRLLLAAPRQLVDPLAAKLIDTLQQQSIKAMALTSLYHGKFGVIPSIEDWRINMLKSHGIDFGKSFPGVESFRLDALAREGLIAPMFKHGAVFMHRYTKGEVLAAFLKRQSLTPSTIIFVDDQRHNLESVAAAVEQLGIPYQGLHFVASNMQTGEIDERVGRLQLQHFLETGEWLSDAEALLQLDQNLF